jgi:hypothetical protein
MTILSSRISISLAPFYHGKKKKRRKKEKRETQNRTDPFLLAVR